MGAEPESGRLLRPRRALEAMRLCLIRFVTACMRPWMMPSSRLAFSRAYRVDVLEPFDLRVVEDEAGCFDPAKPVGTPPVWLLVRGDEAPRPGMPCLTLAVTALDGVNESGEVHAAVETGWPKDLPEGALNGARFALWVLRDLLDGGSQEC